MRNKLKQVRRWASPSISQMTHWRLHWCQSSVHPWHPLHYLKREKREEKRRKFYIYPDVTHTHPAEPGKPWKARGRKKRTHDGPTAKKQRGGGRGTDGPPEPTYTAKRTWQKQSTHLNPTTHYGEASRRVIRDQWGLVGAKRKQQNRTQFLTT